MNKALPKIMYGTAWKESSTARLVQTAVSLGFRAIDTANQKKHYREDYVGDALVILEKQGVPRESLFLQSKFTYINGQDHRLPYDPKDSFSQQVKSSFASTLKNLRTDYLDSYILHGPSSGAGLQNDDWEVWETMEDLHVSGLIKMIGISNVGPHHLKELFENANVKPMFVQNRCYAQRGWDREVRHFCKTHNITYQGFSLLTANPDVVESAQVAEISARLKKTPEQVVLRFCQQIGMLPLTGTSNETHMKQDLEIETFELATQEIAQLDRICGE